ncbi:MAG: integrin alpha [Phycisphaerales bacterium]
MQDRCGVSVSSAGDVNGDGVDDIIIGAYWADPNGQGAAGESYVVYGGAKVGSSGVINLSTLNGENGLVLQGISSGDYSGYSVSAAGDVNGDGIDDVIIGAMRADPRGASNAGASYVVFGGESVATASTFELSSLNGSNGFVLNGVSSFDLSGISVSSAGDVNGDGIDDIIIGAMRGDPNGNYAAGECYVLFGNDSLGFPDTIELSSLDGANGFVMNGIDEDDNSARSVSSAGDVNDDGVDDLIIGAYRAAPDGRFTAGESYVVFGGPTVGSSGEIELSSLNGTNGYVLNGIDTRDRSGHSVSSAGDVNGDGVDDLIIGAFYASPNGEGLAGECYVVFGGPTVGSSGEIELSSLNGANGFVLNGVDGADRCGWAVSSAGDFNGDGFGDLIIGAFRASPHGKERAGESYIVFGSESAGSSGALDLSSLDGTNGFVLNGLFRGDYSGFSVSTAGDVNGDGLDDVIIGAYHAWPNGINTAGESYVVFGRRVPCPADTNDDGTLSPADFTAWISAFHAITDACDQNGDGSCTPADFTAWLANYKAGCP